MTFKYSFEVMMTCGGCSSALSRILDKHLLKDKESYEIDLEKKLVIIKSDRTEKELTDIISKSGKDVKLLSIEEC